MPSKEELESHPVTTLKKEISKTNIKGYSKMKKTEIVELMLKNKSRFHHIKMAEKKPKEEKPKPTPAPKEEKPKKKKLVIKEKPVEKPKPKAKPKNNIKKELEKIVNNHFGRRIKYETKVLNGKLVDSSKEYEEIEDDENEQYEDDLMEFFKKNKLRKINESEYFESDNGSNTKLRNLIKMESLSLKTLSNYIKIGKLNKQIEDKQKAKPVEKPKAKPKAKSNKEIAQELDDTFFKMDLEEALKELKNVDKKDQQSVTNKIRKWNSFVGSLKNKIKKSKDLNLKKLMENVVAAHNELNSKPKAQISEVDKPLLDLSKLKIGENQLNYNNNNVEIIASLLDDEFYLEIFSSQSKKSKPRAPRGEANMVLCEIIKHLLKDKSKYGLDKKSKFTLEAGEIEGTENFNQQKLNKYYMTLGFKKDIKESNATDKTIFTQPISGFIKNCMKFDKDVLSGKKPKPKVDIDKIENTIIDQIESSVVKSGYAVDNIYDLLNLGDFKKPQRERALKIINRIIKQTKTQTRFPEVDVKKRLKL
mgnify:FL=1